MKKWLMLLTAAAAAGLAVPAAQAKIRLPALVGANMVVQQRSQAPLWGWARPGSTVRVTPSWDKKAYPTQADAQGYWRVKVPTRGAGGPYSLTFSDGEKLTIGNVLVGEVWLCAGQSNMEMTMRGFNSQPILNGNALIASSTNDYARFGLTSFGKPLALFEVAGADKVFYPATAAIKGGKVEVEGAQVAAPVAVRYYAYKEFVVGDLFNNDGLPASSFRTDDWE